MKRVFPLPPRESPTPPLPPPRPSPRVRGLRLGSRVTGRAREGARRKEKSMVNAVRKKVLVVK